MNQAIPDGTAFPVKAVGRRGFEILRSLDNGRRSYRVPADQHQRQGMEVPYPSKACAQRVCDRLNAKYEWLTTAPHPNHPKTGFDAGQRGWRLHAVPVSGPDPKLSEIRNVRGACGVLPAHGWHLDMFVERKCKRCMKALGLKTEVIGSWLP